MVEFFEHYLFSGPDRAIARRTLTVCHDMCHSAVMFESQTASLQLYRDAGIRIGKAQVSSAVHVPWDSCVGQADRQAALAAQLSTLDEPKYLHQTSQQSGAGGLQWLQADLPLALAKHLHTGDALTPTFPTQPWLVHFHVPIFVESFGHLQTTQADVAQATEFLQTHQRDCVGGSDWFTGHFEVETYAWPVLPAELAVDDLVNGIARELQYFNQLLS